MRQEMPKEFKSLLYMYNINMVYSPPIEQWNCSGFPLRTMFLSGGNKFSVGIDGAKNLVLNLDLEDYSYLLRIFENIAFIHQGGNCYLVDERCAYAINDFTHPLNEFGHAYNEYMLRMRKNQRKQERGIMYKLLELVQDGKIKKASYNSFVIETDNNIFDIPTHIMLAKSDSIVELLKTKYLSKTKEKLAFIGKLGVMK